MVKKKFCTTATGICVDRKLIKCLHVTASCIQDFDLLRHLIQDEHSRGCHAASSCHGGDKAHTSLSTRNIHDEETLPTGWSTGTKISLFFFMLQLNTKSSICSSGYTHNPRMRKQKHFRIFQNYYKKKM